MQTTIIITTLKTINNLEIQNQSPSHTYIRPKYDTTKDKWCIRCIQEDGMTIERYDFNTYDMAMLMYDGLCSDVNDIEEDRKFSPETIVSAVIEYFGFTPTSSRLKNHVELKRALAYFIHNHTMLKDVDKMKYTFMKARKSMYHHSKKQREFMDVYPDERKKIREIFLFIRCKQV